MVNKKRKKLKGKKLEERIAPGMIGGGVVDPGLADAAAEGPQDIQSDEGAGEIQETQTDSGYISDQTPEGQYVEETGSGTPSMDTVEESHDAPQAGLEGGEFDQGYSEFDQGPGAGGDYVDEGPSWTETDWVTANADGSIDMSMPEGVTVENGIANFPMETANSELPMPEDFSLSEDGSLNISMPEGAEYIEASNTLVLPPESVSLDEIPEDFTAYENPDGSINVAVPEDGVNYDPESNTVNFDNHWANEFTPENMEINENGSVDITFPENAEFHEDGTIHIPADSADFMDNPPPEEFHEMEYANYNPDGSITITPPDGVEVEDGIVSISPDVVNEVLPLDDKISFNEDGHMDVVVPEGTAFDADAGSLTFPPGEVHGDEIPEGINYHLNPDDTLTAYLPDGVDYDADAGSVQFDNHWANEMLPDNMAFSEDGSMQIALPEGTEYFDDGTFTIPSDQVDFVEHEAPHIEGYEYVTPQPDGAYTVHPPEGFVLHPEAQEMHIPHDQVNDLEDVPEDVTFNPDGTMTMELPEGVNFDSALQTLNFPEGELHLDEIPEGINAHVNPDGSITATLPDGITCDMESGTVTCDNYWTNQFIPDEVEYTPEGNMVINCPSDCEYHDDGSFTVPEHSADFIENPPPQLVSNGPEFIDGNPDGSFTVYATEGLEVNFETGECSMSCEFVNEHFNYYMPEEFQLNPDGTSSIMVPEGTQFNEGLNALTFPHGEAHLHDFPGGVDAHINPDATLTTYLPDGMNYDGENINMDNYWTNQIMPGPIEYSPEGIMTVNLPDDTQYFEGGGFNVPEYQTDFMEDPGPHYYVNGPEWVDCDPQGNIHCHYPDGCHVDPEVGTMTMPADMCNEHFEDYRPDEFQLNPDGTATMSMPEGTLFNADANALTFSEGQVHMNEIPEGIDANINDDGTLTVQIPEGMNYDAGANSIHMNNYWVNEVTPQDVSITTDGDVTVNLPDNTQYHEGNNFIIPEDSADFMAHPAPDYIDIGPDWATENPDGSITVLPPEGVNFDQEMGIATMPTDLAQESFPNLIQQDLNFGPDGTSTLTLPEGTQFNADTNAVTFPEGAYDIHQIPGNFDAILNADGTITAEVPVGMEYDVDANHMNLDNHWTNTVLPQNMEYTNDGQIQINLPSDTQYYGEDGFVISAESADFMENPGPSYCYNGPDWINENPDGSVTFTPPGDVQIDPNNGTMSAPGDYINEHFEDHIPDDMTFNPDGSADIVAPQGVTYDETAGTLTLPPGDSHPGDFPEQIEQVWHVDGSVTITMPEGMSFNPDSGVVHIENELLNELSPPHVHYSPDGMMTMECPEHTHYGEYDGGQYCTMPEEDARNFA